MGPSKYRKTRWAVLWPTQYCNDALATFGANDSLEGPTIYDRTLLAQRISKEKKLATPQHSLGRTHLAPNAMPSSRRQRAAVTITSVLFSLIACGFLELRQISTKVAAVVSKMDFDQASKKQKSTTTATAAARGASADDNNRSDATITTSLEPQNTTTTSFPHIQQWINNNNTAFVAPTQDTRSLSACRQDGRFDRIGTLEEWLPFVGEKAVSQHTHYQSTTTGKPYQQVDHLLAHARL